MKVITALVMGAFLFFSVPTQAKVEKTAWGETPDHKKVDLYTLSNSHGLIARISTYGGAVVGLDVPDRNGRMADIVRGFDAVSGYFVPDTASARKFQEARLAAAAAVAGVSRFAGGSQSGREFPCSPRAAAQGNSAAPQDNRHRSACARRRLRSPRAGRVACWVT